MKVLITGTSSGIGYSIAQKFLCEGHQVVGIDVKESMIGHDNYTHIVGDIVDELPDVSDVDILINNAGVQCEWMNIEVNLMGTIRCTEKYGIRPGIHAIINIASTSAHTGAEFPIYSASKGGVLAYTKNAALRVAKFGATCNSISPGGVTTTLNAHIMADPDLWEAVKNETLLKQWTSANEIAEWAYFIACVNKNMTGQDIIIDSGEMAKFNFIW